MGSSQAHKEAVGRYNSKNYAQVSAWVPKEIAEAFKAKCKADGTSQAQIIKDAIDAYLKQA